MADCPLSLGDLTGEGGSPGMEQTECGKGQTAGAEARASSASAGTQPLGTQHIGLFLPPPQVLLA